MRGYFQKTHRSVIAFCVDAVVIISVYYLITAVLWGTGLLSKLVVIPLAMALAANRWMAIGILSHDAYHYTFHRNKKVNDFFGHLTALFIMNDFKDARRAHLAHHQHLFGEGDLDARVAHEMVRLGLNNWKLWWISPLYMLRHAKRILAIYENEPKGLWGSMRPYMMQVSLLLGLGAIDWRLGLIHFGIVYLAMAFHLARSFLEHCHMPEGVKTRSYYGGHPLLNWTLYAHNIGYHDLHHNFPGIPWYNLAKAHKDGLKSTKSARHHQSGAAHADETVESLFIGGRSARAIARRFPFVPKSPAA